MDYVKGPSPVFNSENFNNTVTVNFVIGAELIFMKYCGYKSEP